MGREQLDSLVFVSSEFLRARQTAEECRAALQNIVSFERQATAGVSRGGGGVDTDAASEEAQWVDSGETGGYDVCPPVVIRQELRERSFGELDGTILINYNKVHDRRAVLTACDSWHCFVLTRVPALQNEYTRMYVARFVLLT